ncbi:MAG: cell wall-binding repeat-containing protein, partial [Firmicutes bacterium]|nr:cell wall-binding repeat-containing protein [Bacillota bacterium]
MKRPKKWKRLLGILLPALLIAVLFPTVVLAQGSEGDTDVPHAFTEEDDQILEDDVFALIREAEEDYAEDTDGDGAKDDEPADVAALTEQDYIEMLPNIIAAIESSDTYVEGSLQQNGYFLTWETTTGMPCCFDPWLEERLNGAEAVGGEGPETEPEAQPEEEDAPAAKGDQPLSVEIGLIQPYWKDATHYYDATFNDYSPDYLETWQTLYGTTGGSANYRYTLTDASVDNIAKTIENCGLVLIDSHGATDYSDGYGDRTSKANCSYICIKTKKGITTADCEPQTGPFGTYYHYLKSSNAYYISGTCIANHMTKKAPSSFVWLGACLGMATDGLCAPLRAHGVEAVFGYSQTVTFPGDRDYMENAMASINAGSSLSKAIGKMKEDLGYWDPGKNYATLETARENRTAFPIVASSADPYPGHGNVDTYQDVFSKWKLNPEDLVLSGTAAIPKRVYTSQSIMITFSGNALYFAEAELAFQWQRKLGDGWSNISGATKSTYQCAAADAFRTLRVVVTAPGYEGTLASNTCYVQEGVALSEENFPDPVFREYLADNYDKDHSGWLEVYPELEALDTINLGGTDVASLAGLEYLYNVYRVYANHSQITSFDGSGCDMLRILDLSECPLDSLNVADNYNLETLDLEDITGSLKSVDLSGHKYLESLSVYRSKDLAYVDISDCPRLVEAALYGKEAEKTTASGTPYYKTYTTDKAYLAVSTYGSLEDVYVAHFNKAFPSAQFRKEVQAACDWDNDGLLELGEAKDVTRLFPEDDEDLVTTLAGIEFLPNLEYLSAFNCRIEAVNLSRNVNLTYVDLGGNLLRFLDVSNLKKLTDLDLRYNQLEYINVSQNPKLQKLDVTDNELIALDLSHNPELRDLRADENDIPYLDVSVLPKLEILYVGETKLKSLDVSHNSGLRDLSCYGNPSLTSLDLSGNPKLEYLSVVACGLKNLDISQNPQLRRLGCYGNDFPLLNIGKNPFLQMAYAGKKTSGTNTYFDLPYDLYKSEGTYAELMVDPETVVAYGDLAKAKVAAIADRTYTGSAIKPAVKVVLDGKALVKGVDYTVSYANNTNAGKATVTIKGKGDYAGSIKKTFKILPVDLAKTATKTALSGLTARTYTGAALKPALTVKATVGGKTVTLKKGTDYTVTYKNNTKAGKATVTVTGKGNYTGSKTGSFTIKPADLKGATVAAIKNQTFTGSALKPAPVVKMTLGGKSVTLKAGTDYTVAYKNNTNPGTATVTIKGKGNFTGTATKTFQIVKAKASFTRIAGADRFQTSYQIADRYKQELGVSQFTAACIADGYNYPDALAGAYFAAARKAPILVIHKDAPTGPKTAATIDYLKKNVKKGSTVYILGGPGSVPDAVLNQVKAAGFKVTRLWGANRYASNLEILKAANIKAGTDFIVCTGADFADALSASATGKPVLLVAGNKLTEDQKVYLQAVKAKSFTVIGDSTVVADGVVNELKAYAPASRLTGATIYDRSVAIARKFFPSNVVHVNLADGRNFPDALCGGPLASKLGGPLLLTDGS